MFDPVVDRVAGHRRSSLAPAEFRLRAPAARHPVWIIPRLPPTAGLVRDSIGPSTAPFSCPMARVFAEATPTPIDLAGQGYGLAREMPVVHDRQEQQSAPAECFPGEINPIQINGEGLFGLPTTKIGPRNVPDISSNHCLCPLVTNAVRPGLTNRPARSAFISRSGSVDLQHEGGRRLPSCPAAKSSDLNRDQRDCGKTLPRRQP